ncbi:hypothetical protein [Coleofasciculus sp. FACHB-SPT9]|uniref:hypothetical protein n=1 Tax=Cyanophyceae TaxID=3028117 RepID=UPI0016841E7F|nr:hypothetical protein [Coleofasciculus sp. FACHB-SPT9]MBD1889329.1 hypothetical protein [Coleofasciculus sp. FACHB-SPT9]
MNPKLIMLSAMALGVIGSAFGVQESFDGKLHYCLPVESGCEQRSIPDWMQPPTEALNVRRTPGAAGWKLLGSFVSIAGFGVSMTLARSLSEVESKKQKYSQIWEGVNLQKLKLEAQAELEAFNQQVMLLAAEQSYSVLAPYQEPLEAEVVSEAQSPDTKNASGEPLSIENNNPQTVEPSTPSSPPSEGLSGTVLNKDSETIGMAILDGLVGSRRSTLLVGSTGAGKSVTEAYLLSKFQQRYPNAEIWAIAQKNDSFGGLDKKGRVILFDALDPSEALRGIDHIHGIYDKRRRLPESARTDLNPVRLILADWLSINQALEELKNEEPIKSSKYLTKLADIIYNGRELNVCLIVDLQSFNLAAIGMKADRNSRKNFNLVGLGNYSVDEFGSINESYGVLSNMIGNKDMVADEDERSTLLATFKELKPISKDNQRPIIFTTLEPSRVALLPDLRHYKPGQSVRMKLEGYTPEYLNRILSLEFEIDTPVPPEVPGKTAEVIQDNAQAKEVLRSWFAGKGWVKINRARSMCKSLLKLTKDSDEVRSLINELLQESLVIVNETDEFNVDVTS